jgi:hypothetical protein
MAWMLRLVGSDIDSQSRSFDVMEVSRPTAKWGHDQLLCEMNSAISRRRIISQLSCPASRTADACHHHRTQLNWKP